MIFSSALLAKFLRFPLSLVPHEAEVRILRGPLRGKKWIKGAGPNAYWMGTYEVDRLRALANAISQGSTVYDVGANVGIYSLLASLRVGASGKVYAFEPLARNLGYLRKHIALNQLRNCTVIEKAVCHEEGIRHFSAASLEASMARLSADGEIVVASTSLDRCIYGNEGFRPPDVVKIDVEGAELEVLQGAARVIAEFHPTIFLEIHGPQLQADCLSFLKARNYEVEQAYGRLTATRKGSSSNGVA
jgi:FkbM family methyltransferase